MMKESRGCCRCSDAATASCSGCNRKPVAPMNPAPGKTAYIATHILQTLSSRVSNSRILSAASPMYTCSCSDLQQTTKTKPHARCTPMRSHSGGWQACHCAKPPHPIVEAHNGGWQVSNSGSNIQLWQLASRGMAGLKGGCRSSKWRLAGLTVPDALRTKGRVGVLLPCLPYRAARSVQRPMQAGTEAELTVAAGRPHNVRYLPNQRTSRGSPPLPAIQSCKISAAFDASGR